LIKEDEIDNLSKAGKRNRWEGRGGKGKEMDIFAHVIPIIPMSIIIYAISLFCRGG